MMIVLLSLIMPTSVFAHDEPKTKLVFGKKCTVTNNTVVTQYVWKVEKKDQFIIEQIYCEKFNSRITSILTIDSSIMIGKDNG